MGWLLSSITASTKNIAIESAYFNPVRITKGSRAPGLKTESSMRFERKGDIEILPYSQDMAGYSIQKMALCKIEEDFFDSNPDVKSEHIIEIKKEKGERLLGISLNIEDAVKKIERFGIKKVHNNPVRFLVPSFRRDVEGEADIWEEFARLTGYENIPQRFRIKGDELPIDPRNEFKKLKKTSAFSGFYEIYNLSFMEEALIEQLPAVNQDVKRFVQIENPMWAEKNVMRTTLIPGLIETAERNLNRGVKDIRFFEMGTVFFSPNIEKTYISGILTGSLPREWCREERKYDLYDIKGRVETIMENYGIDNLEFQCGKYPLFEENRCLQIQIGKRTIGFLGEAHRLILERFNVPYAYGFEIDVESLIEMKSTRTRVILPPKFPAIIRDISLILNADIDSKFVLRLIQDMDISLLEEIKLIDLYTGKNIPQGKKSFTYSLTFRDKEGTLKDEEVDRIMQKIFTILEKNKIEIRRQ